MSAHELESTGGADWRGFKPTTCYGLHWERTVINGVVWMCLVEAAFNFHWGDKNLDEPVDVIDRSDILAVRAAAANGQQAFDTAMASTAAAGSYAAMLSAATAAGVTGPEHPANVTRRWWLHCAADYSLS